MAPPELSCRPIYVILNAGAGSAETEIQRQIIEQELASAGRQFKLVVVEQPEQLRQIAERAVAEAIRTQAIVVAAGGDGTINTVARAVIGSGCPFGVLPQGTFNYFARTHGVPQDTAQATQALLASRLRPVQVGRLNDRIFLVNASIGLYPTLLEQREHDKHRFGRSRLVAVLSAIKTILGFSTSLAIQLDLGGQPETIRTPTLFVGNNALQIEQVGIDPAKYELEAGRLLAVAPRSAGRLSMLGLLLGGALGRLGEARQLVAFSFKRMTVRQRAWYRKQAVKVALDGEVTRLKPPLQFEVIEDQLQLLVPLDPVRE